MPTRGLALPRGRRVGWGRIDHRRDKPRFVILGNDRLSFSDLPPPAEQLLR